MTDNTRETSEAPADSVDEQISEDSAGAEAAPEVAPPAEAAATEAPAPPEPAAEKAEVPAAAPEPPPSEFEIARRDGTVLNGKVIGWNNGGFHVVVGKTTAFCPRSEIELGAPKSPESYLDQELPFLVLKIQKGGQRIVLSRAAILRDGRRSLLDELRDKQKSGEAITGRVTNLTDFGAFVDVGGVEGLVHVSELARRRIEHPSEIVKPGQEVQVKILRIEKGGDRISLSMKALEPDPWKEVADKFQPGTLVEGTVEKTADFGAFIELEPGISGLLPTSAMNIPRDTTPARAYPPGRKVSVLISNVDPRRRRIGLALEGSAAEGTVQDYKEYMSSQGRADSGFSPLADAFKRLRDTPD